MRGLELRPLALFIIASKADDEPDGEKHDDGQDQDDAFDDVCGIAHYGSFSWDPASSYNRIA